MRARKTVADRFWAKVDRSGPAHPVLGTPCWVWTAFHDRDGYGRFGGRPPQPASRVAWQLTRGPIPRGMQVMHRCDQGRPPGDGSYRRCVNPDHLRLGTNLENVADMMAKGRAAVGARHGRNTHPERTARGERHGSRTRPGSVPRGSAHPNAVLTEADVATIKAALARLPKRSRGRKDLAALYGVSVDTINVIATGRCWSHVSSAVAP